MGPWGIRFTTKKFVNHSGNEQERKLGQHRIRRFGWWNELQDHIEALNLLSLYLLFFSFHTLSISIFLSYLHTLIHCFLASFLLSIYRSIWLSTYQSINPCSYSLALSFCYFLPRSPFSRYVVRFLFSFLTLCSSSISPLIYQSIYVAKYLCISLPSHNHIFLFL